MCVIAYKPAEARFPSRSRLEECFRRNPDGAGFMYTDGGAVHILKGYTSFAAFWRALQAARASSGDQVPYVIHFRISTQAGARPDCCHPFPLSSNMDDLRALEARCDIGLAHNGIIDCCADYRPGLTYSDTMRFIVDFATLIIRGPGYYKRPATLELLKRLTGSRLAILDARGHCEMIGDGWTEDGGCYYSNKSYLPRPAPAAWTGYGWTDDAPDAWNDDPGLSSIYGPGTWTDYDEQTITRAGRTFTIYRDGPFIELYVDGELIDTADVGDDLDEVPLDQAADMLFSPWIY